MPKAFLISVIDDDQPSRDSMRRLLRSLGYSVQAFSSPGEFLASPCLVETACLIADVHMPVMTGLELYRHLIDKGKAIPTILITGYPNDVDEARALHNGVICYFGKPINEERLIQCLHSVLRSGDPPEEGS